MAEEAKQSENNQKSDQDKLKDAREKFKWVKEHSFEKEWRDNAMKRLKYFTGEDQGWEDEGARAKLEAEQRPALTLNRINPIIRLICGSRPLVETTYLAVEEGDLQTASILNACKDHVEDKNNWDYLEEKWLTLAVILDRACIFIMPNDDRDIRGDIELVLEDGWNVYPDPDSVRKDRQDGQWLFLVKNVSKEWLLNKFPKKKEEIDNLAQYSENSSTIQSKDTDPVDRYKDIADYYNPETKKYSVVYFWYKKYEKATKIIDMASSRVMDSPLSKREAEKRIEELGATDRFTVMEREYTRVYYKLYTNDILWEEGVNPWERKDGKRTVLSDNIPVVIFEPDRIIFGTKQELMSVIDPLMDPQRYHNKLASSILSIINTTAKSGTDYERGAISPLNLKKLEDSGSKPGVNIEWEKDALSGNKVRKREPTVIPTAEMAMSKEFTKELLDISGVESLVSTERLGKGASGIAIDLKQRQGGNVISWIYRSFSFFRHVLAEYERDAIQATYDYEKVVRIRGTKAKYIRINEQIYDEFGGIEQVLNDVTSGQYDIQVREKESIPTLRLERLKHFSETVKSGALQLPPQVMVKIYLELMDDPDLKEMVEKELGEFMEQQRQMLAMQAGQGGGMPPGIPPGPRIQPQAQAGM